MAPDGRGYGVDYRQVFSDEAVRQEFLDRYDEIAGAAAASSGFENIGPRPGVDEAADAVRRMTEGTWVPDDSGLEAIVERFARPVHLVQRSSFVLPADGHPTSREVTARLERARPRLEAAIPGVGRVDLRNHRHAWVGTGWMVAPGLVVTNRHVAQEFARPEGSGFVFARPQFKPVRAALDWYHEYRRPEESRFAVREVVWIEPEPGPDVALLRIAGSGEDGERPPSVIALETASRARGGDVGRWVAVIGYPAQDSRARGSDQQRIFDGVYDVKRLSGGRITAVEGEGVVHHDATTLGGNSGSAVIDLETGRAAALHFGYLDGGHNAAVHASVLARIVRLHGR
ncbi:trypsin-like serine peptidase [Streptomyces sp. t39]|uniref:trypsin-like serine peptidase n=1 Tax=Streptomyces sp. t39 TaxID=1828156 RepID=UPI0011CD90D3|nr:serine protease [Streptomyces sp. t39]TXS54415.1 serine protease [Streptomyces sp. t39]